MKFFEDQNILTDYQHGFRKKRACSQCHAQGDEREQEYLANQAIEGATRGNNNFAEIFGVRVIPIPTMIKNNDNGSPISINAPEPITTLP